MPLYDNDRLANYPIGKLYDCDSLENHQISKLYDNDRLENHLIYTAEETIFSGVNVETAWTSAGWAGESYTAYSPAYDIDFSYWDTLAITGTVGANKGSGGDYNRTSIVNVECSLDGGSSWQLLVTLFDEYLMWETSRSVNVTVDISNITAKNGKLRMYCKVQNDPTDRTSNGNTYCNDMQCIAM